MNVATVRDISLNRTQLYVVDINDSTISVVDTVGNSVVGSIALFDESPRHRGDGKPYATISSDTATRIDPPPWRRRRAHRRVSIRTRPCRRRRLYVSNITHGTVS